MYSPGFGIQEPPILWAQHSLNPEAAGDFGEGDVAMQPWLAQTLLILDITFYQLGQQFTKAAQIWTQKTSFFLIF